MRILRAQDGVGPTGKEVRENERFQRKAEKEQRLLEKFAKKQSRRTGMSETEALLEALNNPEQFEAFKASCKRKRLQTKPPKTLKLRSHSQIYMID